MNGRAINQAVMLMALEAMSEGGPKCDYYTDKWLGTPKRRKAKAKDRKKRRKGR